VSRCAQLTALEKSARSIDGPGPAYPDWLGDRIAEIREDLRREADDLLANMRLQCVYSAGVQVPTRLYERIKELLRQLGTPQ
jgi:hypothetical protein